MRKVVLCLGLMAMLAMATSAFAAQAYTEYRGVDGGSWSVASNWSAGVPQVFDSPGVQNTVSFGKAGFKGWSSNGGKSPGLYGGTTVNVDQIVVGGAGVAAGGGYMNLDGATVNVSEYIHIGNGATDIGGTMTINSGTLNVGVFHLSQGFLRVGFNGAGTLNMNGGNLNLYQYLAVADGSVATSNGTVNLTAGVITATDLKMKGTGTSLGTALMIVKDGFLVLNNATDLTSKIDGFVTAGLLRAFTGYTIHREFDAESQTTTVWATPEPATVCLLGLGVIGLLRKKK